MSGKSGESEILTVRLDKTSKRQLQNLAKATDRSKSYLAGEAIRQYLDLQTWQVEGIRQGLKEAQQGRFADPAKVAKLLKRHRTS
jgi:predicted transcriptional regulator